MKTKTTLFISHILLFSFLLLTQQACKKEKKDADPPVYTNGQGEIGEIGGTMKLVRLEEQ